jgi:hypothetical protein
LLDIKGTHDAKIVRVDGDFTKAQGLAEGYAHKNKCISRQVTTATGRKGKK